MQLLGFVGSRKARLPVNGNDVFMDAVVDRILREHSNTFILIIARALVRWQNHGRQFGEYGRLSVAASGSN